MQEILKRIENADEFEIHQIMQSVERRYAAAYPDWDVLYIAVHKDPVIRKTELAMLMPFLEKDLQTCVHNAKKDSLG